MLENWGGHISAAVYLLGKDDTKKIQAAITRNPKLQRFVDFHLVTATEVRIFMLKNLMKIALCVQTAWIVPSQCTP
jgi:cobyric acid synthase